MPKNWLEELIEEYYQLKGYFVRTNVPFLTTPSGGRKELDIVATKSRVDYYAVCHIESGSCSSVAQFGEATEKFHYNILELLAELGIPYQGATPSLYKEYIGLYPPKMRVDEFKAKAIETGFEFTPVWEFIPRVIAEVKKWAPKTVPENLWLTKLLERVLRDKIQVE